MERDGKLEKKGKKKGGENIMGLVVGLNVSRATICWQNPTTKKKKKKVNNKSDLVDPTQGATPGFFPASCQAEVAMRGLVCQPNIRDPFFSSTPYPSPPA